MPRRGPYRRASRSPLCGLASATGLTQAEIARELGVSPWTLSRWLNGHTAPSQSNKVRLAKVLTLSLEDLEKEFHAPVPELEKVNVSGRFHG